MGLDYYKESMGGVVYTYRLLINCNSARLGVEFKEINNGEDTERTGNRISGTFVKYNIFSVCSVVNF